MAETLKQQLAERLPAAAPQSSSDPNQLAQLTKNFRRYEKDLADEITGGEPNRVIDDRDLEVAIRCRLAEIKGDQNALKEFVRKNKAKCHKFADRLSAKSTEGKDAFFLARHTFAVRAGQRALGIPEASLLPWSPLLQELLMHVQDADLKQLIQEDFSPASPVPVQVTTTEPGDQQTPQQRPNELEPTVQQPKQPTTRKNQPQQLVERSQTEQEQAQQPSAQQPNPQRTTPEQIIWKGEPVSSLSSARLIFTFYNSFRKIGPLLPIIASIITLLFYLSPSLLNILPLFKRLPQSPWTFPIVGFISALIITFIYVYFSLPFAATSSGMRDYALLESSENELLARLGNPNIRDEITKDDMISIIGIPNLKWDRRALAALRQACNTFLALYRSLHSPRRFMLLSNAGDIYAWGMVHRAEEALTEIEEISIVIREAMHDYSVIRGSNIDNRDELLKKLLRAVEDLDPEAVEYLEANESDKKLDSIQKEIRELHKALETKNIIPTKTQPLTEEEQTNDQGQTQNSQLNSSAEIRARASIHYVKHTLNKFQEDRLAGLIQARDNLILSVIASGLITYALLSLSIAALYGYVGAESIITSATAIYTIGVTAGLFGRLYAEANKESATNDYGLSRARLLAIPLISGLAAIGGVFITATALPATNQPSQLVSIFTLDTRYILAAVLFGFAPNLLIRSFQQKADQYASDLESTKAK